MKHNPEIEVYLKDGSSFRSTQAFEKDLMRVQGHLISRIEVVGGYNAPVVQSDGDAARIATINKILSENKPPIDREKEIDKIMDVKGLAPLQKQLKELGITPAEMREQGIRTKRQLAEKIFELTNK